MEREPLTVDEVRNLRSKLTWGDQFEASKDATEPAETAARALWRRARLLGLVDPDLTLEGFLDLIPVDVMSEALEEPRDPTSADGSA